MPLVYFVVPPANSTLRRVGDDGLALRHRLRSVQRMTIDCAHVVHADRGDGLDARVDLRRADGEAAAAANAEHADAPPIHEGLITEVIDGSTESFCIEVR